MSVILFNKEHWETAKLKKEKKKRTQLTILKVEHIKVAYINNYIYIYIILFFFIPFKSLQRVRIICHRNDVF